MILTKQTIDRLRTNGVFTRATVEALGFRWEALEKGWVDRLIGSEIADEDYIEAFAGVGVSAKKYKAAVKQQKRLQEQQRLDFDES
jgi:hypothetical protein